MSPHCRFYSGQEHCQVPDCSCLASATGPVHQENLWTINWCLTNHIIKITLSNNKIAMAHLRWNSYNIHQIMCYSKTHHRSLSLGIRQTGLWQIAELNLIYPLPYLPVELAWTGRSLSGQGHLVWRLLYLPSSLMFVISSSSFSEIATVQSCEKKTGVQWLLHNC